MAACHKGFVEAGCFQLVDRTCGALFFLSFVVFLFLVVAKFLQKKLPYHFAHVHIRGEFRREEVPLLFIERDWNYFSTFAHVFMYTDRFKICQPLNNFLEELNTAVTDRLSDFLNLKKIFNLFF